MFLGFEPPEEEGAPPRLSFYFHDRKGNEVFRLNGNEVQCDSIAFDIESIGPVWTVRSKMYHVDLVIRFDPPTRITVEKLHFRHLKWELKAEIGKLELLFDGKPVQAYGGGAKISGPVFLRLAENAAHIEMADIEIIFGAGPAPIATIPAKSGFTVSFPVFCPINPETNQHQIVEFAEGHRTLAVYTQKEIGEDSSADGWQIMPLSKERLCKVVQEYGANGTADSVSFNPSKKMLGISSWQDFMHNLGCPKPEEIEKIDPDDPIIKDFDSRGAAIQFPLFLLVNANPDTPKHEVDFAVVRNQLEILPVFTTNAAGEVARILMGEQYELTELGPKGFVGFLGQIVLPRQVQHMCFNPQLEEQEEEQITEIIEIDAFLANFRFDIPDAELEKRVKNGELKKL